MGVFYGVVWELFYLSLGSSWSFSGPAELQDFCLLLPSHLPLGLADLEMLSVFIDSQLSDLGYCESLSFGGHCPIVNVTLLIPGIPGFLLCGS